MDLSFITDNIAQFLIGSGLIGVVGVYIVRYIFSQDNIESVARQLDEWVDQLQKDRPQIGKETRQRIIMSCKSIIKALEA